MDNENTPPKDN